MDYGAPFQLAHTGSGVMTSSLSVGKAGSAAVRRLMQYPLSPIITTGRSNIKQVKMEHPQYHGVMVTKEQLQQLADDQWPSRSRSVHTREWQLEQLQKMSG